MSDELDAEVERFLQGADAALEEYEQGYADADATLSVIETHIESLREAHEEQ